MILESEAIVRRRHRINVWELTLWILGALLLALAAVILYYYVRSYLEQANNLNVGVTVTFGVAFLQISSLFTPPLVTGGIVCIALAIFLRGLDVNARRRNLDHAASEPDPVGIPVEPVGERVDPQLVAPPVARPETPTDDYTPFMRPAEDPAAPTK